MFQLSDSSLSYCRHRKKKNTGTHRVSLKVCTSCVRVGVFTLCEPVLYDCTKKAEWLLKAAYEEGAVTADQA